MILSIYDGRTEFYQWDINQKLIVSDPTITEVHFCNQTEECSLVCEVYEEDGIRLVNVPNILLQDNWPIKAYAYCDCTKASATFDVKVRSKPADYVYTETEVRTWQEITRRLDEIDISAGGIVDVDELPPKGMNGFYRVKGSKDLYYYSGEWLRIATNKDIDGLNKAIKDVGDKEAELSEKLDGLEGRVNELKIPTELRELTGDPEHRLVRDEDIIRWNQGGSGATPDLDGYVTEEDLETKGYITAKDIPEIPTVPTNVSAFDNDAGYLTEKDLPEIPDNYVTTDVLEGKGYLAESQALRDFAEKDHTHRMDDIAGYVPPDLSGYAKVDHEHSQYLTEHQDLSGYALKDHEHTEHLTKDNIEEKLGFTAKYDRHDSPIVVEKSLPKKLSDLDSDDDSIHVTLADKNRWDSIKDANGESVDLSGFSKVGHKHHLRDIEDYEAPDLSKYAFKDHEHSISDITDYVAPVLEETDPTVPAWAKAETKPTYTAEEVGALPVGTPIPTVPTNVSAFVNDAGYLTKANIPVYDETVSYTHDGTSVKLDESAMLNRCSETPFAREKIVGAKCHIKYSFNNGENEGTIISTITDEYIGNPDYDNDIATMFPIEEHLHTGDVIYGSIINVYDYEQLSVMLGAQFPSSGVYLGYVGDDSSYQICESLEISDIKKLDDKYLDLSVPTKVSELENDAGYITAEDVPEPDLADYVKNTDIADSNKAGVIEVSVGNSAAVVYRTQSSKRITLGNMNSYIEAKNTEHAIRNKDLEYAIKVGLTTNTKTLTDAEKVAAKKWLGINESAGDSDELLDFIATNGSIGLEYSDDYDQFIGIGECVETDIEIADVVRNVKVTSTYPTAMQGNANITSVLIGKYMTLIEVATFRNCSSLKTVYIDGVIDENRTLHIRTNAFLNTNITDVYVAVSEEIWKSGLVTIDVGNEAFTTATFHYNWKRGDEV